MPPLAELTRKAINASPAIRATADRPLAQEVIQAQRAARLLAPARRFAINQRHRGAVGCYRLRGGDTVVRLRHRTRYAAIVNEIFATGLYEPPAGLRLGAALRVVDAGANIGLFGLFAFERWEVRRLQSYEPDPGNAALLRANAACQAERWKVTEA